MDSLKKKLSDDFSDCKICIEDMQETSIILHKHICLNDLKATIKNAEEVGYYQPMIRPLRIIHYGDFKISHCQECKKVFILIPKLQPIPKGRD